MLTNIVTRRDERPQYLCHTLKKRSKQSWEEKDLKKAYQRLLHKRAFSGRLTPKGSTWHPRRGHLSFLRPFFPGPCVLHFMSVNLVGE